MSAETITLIASIVVTGIVLVILAFAAFVFWSAFSEGERRRQKGVSAKKSGPRTGTAR